MRGKRAERVGAMVGVGAGNPLRAVCHIRYSVGHGGPGQVLSGSTRGPDKVRFKNNSQIRYTGAKFGLERGKRIWEPGCPPAHGHISPETRRFALFFRGSGADEPPDGCA